MKLYCLSRNMLGKQTFLFLCSSMLATLVEWHGVWNKWGQVHPNVYRESGWVVESSP